MRRSRWYPAILLGAAVILPRPAAAQGFGVLTHGSCATALGGAGVARPCDDGSAVLFNPAAIANLPSVVSGGWTASRGRAALIEDRTLERVGTEGRTLSLPFGYITYRFTEQLAAGLGFFPLYSNTIDWPQDFAGRFVTHDARMQNVYIQPTVAYAVAPWLSLGLGVDVVRGSIDQRRFLDLSAVELPVQPIRGRILTFGQLGVPAETEFAHATLSGRGTGLSFHLAAQARLGKSFSAGIRYLHSVGLEYDGDATFDQVDTHIVLPPGNPLSVPGNPFAIPTGSAVPLDAVLTPLFGAGQIFADQGVGTSLTLPGQLTVGLGIRPMPSLHLLADYERTGWSSFGTARVIFSENGPDEIVVLEYRDANAIRFGADYEATDGLNLRAGYAYSTAAQREASVSPLFPEGERSQYSLGAGYRFGAAFALDAAYQFVNQQTRRGRVSPRISFDQTAAQLNTGIYTASAHALNLTFSYRFGAPPERPAPPPPPRRERPVT